MTVTESAPPVTVQRVESGRPLELLPVALALGFAALGLRPLSDPDVWWHLRTGQLILHAGFTHHDPWSSASTNAWVLHEWASEVIMYLSYAIGGYRGVMLLHTLVMLLMAFLLLRSIRREAGPVVTFLVGAMALFAVYERSAERPLLASWCLLAVVLPALRRSFEMRQAPWWLPPVIWVWANLHGLWSAALFIYAVMVAGLILETGFRRWHDNLRFVYVGLVAGIAACVTPNGPVLLTTPLHVRKYAPFVSEWVAPSILRPQNFVPVLFLAVVVTHWARSKARVPAVELMFVAAATFIGLSYARTVPVLVIAIAPLAARACQSWMDKDVPAVQLARPDRLIAAGLASVFLGCLVILLPNVPTTFRGAPWKASAQLDALPGRAKVLNEYALGGWLLWTARDTSPGIDGRTEIYSVGYVSHYLDALKMHKGWETFVEQSHFDAAWLYRDTPLVFGLRSSGWKVQSQDDSMVILLPPAG